MVPPGSARVHTAGWSWSCALRWRRSPGCCRGRHTTRTRAQGPQGSPPRSLLRGQACQSCLVHLCVGSLHVDTCLVLCLQMFTWFPFCEVWSLPRPVTNPGPFFCPIIDTHPPGSFVSAISFLVCCLQFHPLFLQYLKMWLGLYFCQVGSFRGTKLLCFPEGWWQSFKQIASISKVLEPLKLI